MAPPGPAPDDTSLMVPPRNSSVCVRRQLPVPGEPIHPSRKSLVKIGRSRAGTGRADGPKFTNSVHLLDDICDCNCSSVGCDDFAESSSAPSLEPIGRTVYQSATMTRARPDAGAPAADVRTRSARPTTAPSAALRRPAAATGESCVLLIVDAIAVVAVTSAAGSPWIAAAFRTVTVLAALGVAGLYRARLGFSVLDDLPRMILSLTVVVTG